MGDGTDESRNGAVGFEAQPLNPVRACFKTRCENLEALKIVFARPWNFGGNSDMMKTPALHRSSGWRLLKLPMRGYFGVGGILQGAHRLPFYFAPWHRASGNPSFWILPDLARQPFVGGHRCSEAPSIVHICCQFSEFVRCLIIAGSDNNTSVPMLSPSNDCNSETFTRKFGSVHIALRWLTIAPTPF